MALPVIEPDPISTSRDDKLYIVVRADLSYGAQIVQSLHAATRWCLDHPESAALWGRISDSIITVTVPDDAALLDLADKARDRGIPHVLSREPDYGDEPTALALTPGRDTKRLCSGLPLAGDRNDPRAAREALLRKQVSKMRSTEQMPGMDVLAHGISVREHYRTLLDHLAGRVDLHTTSNWDVPAWIDENRERLLAAQLPAHVMDRYLTLHDIGKPDCLVIDEQGRRHFPEHAAVSTRIYRETCPQGWGDDRVAHLIASDMDAHLLKAVDVPDFAARPESASLLLAALSEVTSNAAMFGGTSSDGFKIKARTLTKRAKAAIAWWNTHGWPDPADDEGAAGTSSFEEGV